MLYLLGIDQVYHFGSIRSKVILIYCGVMEVDGHRLIWKIDYYDRSRICHSPDAADPKVTVRVLTVMLAEEY